MAQAPQLRQPIEEAAERRIEVTQERLLQDWKIAHERAHAYMAALRVPEHEREELAADAIERALRHEPWEPGGDAISETMQALRAE